MACPYCYARAMYKRFKWNPEVRFEPSVFNDLPKLKAGSRVFWGSTMELFGDWIDPEWMGLIMERVKAHPELIHIFLTKQPQNLAKFSPFPDNCSVGVTVTDASSMSKAGFALLEIEAKVKYLSIEPFLSPFYPNSSTLKKVTDWVIIGACTGTKEALLPLHHKTNLMMVRLNGNRWSLQPELGWVQTIALAVTKADIPLFLKDNLKPLLPNRMPFYGMYIWKEYKAGVPVTLSENRYRQEMPE